MVNYSNEENINRRKVNYVNYKDLCEKLKLPVYKRGSEEKKKQLEELERTKNIHKNKDNSFTQINEEFKRKKVIEKEEKIAKKTISIGEHSIFVGIGKYKFDKFENMRALFLDFISNSNSNSKKQYIEEFYSDCYLFSRMYDDDFRKEVTDSKSKAIAWDIFQDECRYVFDQFLKTCKEVLGTFIAYYDSENEMIDFLACEYAWRIAVQELNFKYFDYKKRIHELYAKVDEVLIDNGFNSISWKQTKYYIKDENNEYKYFDRNNDLYVRDMTKLYEIIKYTVIKKLRKRSVALGEPRNKSYGLYAYEFKEEIQKQRKLCYLMFLKYNGLRKILLKYLQIKPNLMRVDMSVQTKSLKNTVI